MDAQAYKALTVCVKSRVKQARMAIDIRARHAAPIKVCRRPGDRMDPNDLVSVSIRPTPHAIDGDLSPDVMHAVSAWIAFNEVVLRDYWDGAIDTVELASRPRRV
jgi:hypothetical protein